MAQLNIKPFNMYPLFNPNNFTIKKRLHVISLFNIPQHVASLRCYKYTRSYLQQEYAYN